MHTSIQRKLQSLRRRHRMPPNALCSIRTVNHGCLDTKKHERADLKLASRIESAPRLVSSIAWPLMQRRTETFRATERLRGIRLAAPPQHAGWRQFFPENNCTTTSKINFMNVKTCSLYPCDEACEVNMGTVGLEPELQNCRQRECGVVTANKKRRASPASDRQWSVTS